jgi:hypothetical protein
MGSGSTARLMDAVAFGTTFTVAVAVLDESWVETACTVADAVDEMFAGAVYRPADETVPVAELPPAVPFTFQVTDPLWPPLTVAVNCCVPPGFSVADMGLTFTETGFEEPPQEASAITATDSRASCKCRITGPESHLEVRTQQSSKGGL